MGPMMHASGSNAMQGGRMFDFVVMKKVKLPFIEI